MRVITVSIITLIALGTYGCAKKAEEATPAQTQAKATAEMQKPAKPAAPVTKKPMVTQPMSNADAERLSQTVASSFGKGTVKNAAGVSYTFQIEGSKLKDDSSYGKFRFYSFQEGGKLDVSGTMNCVVINSPARQIWMTGEITSNSSTADQFKSGRYATGSYVHFRARPNSMKEQEMIPGAIEIPTFTDATTAAAFCKEQAWSDAALLELGENDLIAAIP